MESEDDSAAWIVGGGRRRAVAKSSSVVWAWQETTTGRRWKVWVAIKLSSSTSSSMLPGVVLMRQCSRAIKHSNAASSRSLSSCTLRRRTSSAIGTVRRKELHGVETAWAEGCCWLFYQMECPSRNQCK